MFYEKGKNTLLLCVKRNEIVVLEISRKLVMDILDLEIIVNDEKRLQIRRLGKNWITHATCIINICQGKVAGLCCCSFILQQAMPLVVIEVLIV